MVRYETVEVTEEIMKNMAKKRTPRKASGSSSTSGGQAKRFASSPGNILCTSPSSSSSSCSGPADSQLASPHPKDSGQSVYCVLSTVPGLGADDDPSRDLEPPGAPSGAVRVLTEVARGLGMDVV